jgi:hypothetical protein
VTLHRRWIRQRRPFGTRVREFMNWGVAMVLLVVALIVALVIRVVVAGTTLVWR